MKTTRPSRNGSACHCGGKHICLALALALAAAGVPSACAEDEQQHFLVMPDAPRPQASSAAEAPARRPAAGASQASAAPAERSDSTPPLKRPPAPYQQRSNQKLLLKGQVTYLVPRGTPFKLKLASVPTTGLRLMDRGLDGKLPPAELGQEITAKIVEDLYVDDNKVIPEGTVFHGQVTRIMPPRRFGRPGSLVLTFDHFTTPDGKKFAFRAEANNFRESTLKSKAKGAAIIAAHAAGGAIVGALVAYQIFGLENTIALHGYNIAGGAAGGALAATAYAMLRKGERAVLEPGDDLNLEIDTDLLLPAAIEPTAKKVVEAPEGLEIEILKSKVLKDGLDGYHLRVDALITNDTDKKLSSLDLFMEDDNGHQFPVSPGPEEESEMIFHIAPRSMKRVRFYFQVEYPKLKRKLVWFEHATRRKLVTMRLP